MHPEFNHSGGMNGELNTVMVVALCIMDSDHCSHIIDICDYKVLDKVAFNECTKNQIKTLNIFVV